MMMGRRINLRLKGQRGASFVELALILPLLVIMVFGIIDLGRLIQTRLIVTNVSREGGSLASRDISTGSGLITILQSSASPLDMAQYGKIWVTNIKAGVSAARPDPTIDPDYNPRLQSAGLAIPSSVVGNPGATPTGWITTTPLYPRLQFDTGNNTADLSQITVVEIFYFYTPITPLPNFIATLFPNSFVIGGQSRIGLIIGSRAVF